MNARRFGEPGERIDQRRDLVAHLGALLGHRQQQEREGDGVEHRSERHDGEDRAAEEVRRATMIGVDITTITRPIRITVCVMSRMIVGQRDSNASARSRQNS